MLFKMEGKINIHSYINMDWINDLCSRTNLDIIEFLQEIGLISKSYHCSQCHSNMALVRSNVSDGYQWRCRSTTGNIHDVRRSIRNGTWFEKSRLSIRQIIKLTYYWVEAYPQRIVLHEMRISSHTLVDWYNFSREVCTNIIMESEKKIGGIGKIVEIDESKFGKRKYNKGKRVDGQWVFGGVCRETKECFLYTVEDRSKETLLALIKEKIEPGTTIHSDCWKSYNCLDDEGYHHLSVNHSITFKNSANGCHTNTIEGLWAQVKSKLPERNRQKILFDSYLSEYMYRHQISDKGNIFSAFMSDIAKVFKPLQNDEV